ncbi:hypothetical protein BJX63DRAFT_436790 [Aspergillus granulosus]|uniref:Azaphilone pigments biosynthesis cluster protein L N-terminal domain-containing protein n=1 Tax=Aspergillus granulosus TaxID=176169 RepID=A0ABR4GWZ6_9EURO
MDSFQSPPTTVREILRGLRALMEVLGPLGDTAGTDIDVDLTALRFILSRCGIACNEFKEEIGKQLPYSDDGSVSPQGLAKLRYMGGSIDIFSHLLSGYKSAFEVTLKSTHIRRQPFVTAESVESHKNLIKTAKSDLGYSLERLEEIRGSNIDLDACGLQKLKEQSLSMEKCLQICAHFFESVDLFEVKQEENSHVPESHDQTASPKECEKQNFSTFNNHSTGDAVLLTVSTNERTIHGSNNALGWRSRYLVGHVNDESVQKVSQDFVRMNTAHLEQKDAPTWSNTSLTPDNELSSRPGPEYIKRYGEGSVLSKGAPTSPKI